ncbi:hypothetical protein EA473_20950 [Natrarchaeobius chitinivorans]|uniref:Uncharacterized protein n=1 Tax=Natrarchaeobius chitinivorans TaxID=1679083 RepID=A0A3N6M5F0_NATCH|nr:hypothetical protein EA473_20950 [Natrarchaeobius chitinivorans]
MTTRPKRETTDRSSLDSAVDHSPLFGRGSLQSVIGPYVAFRSSIEPIRRGLVGRRHDRR